MRNKLAKQLRKDVMIKAYTDETISEKEVRKGKHDVMREPEFKRMYRARKRNELNARRGFPQFVKAKIDHSVYDRRMWFMNYIRVNGPINRRSK